LTKLWILSDLHLEFFEGKYSPNPPKHDFLILAGDIDIGIKNSVYSISHLSNNPIIQIAGNHEYYRRYFENEINAIDDVRSAGWNYLENHTYISQEHNIKFIGCTLWSDFNIFNNQQESMILSERYINDFFLINHNGRNFRPEYALKIHKTSLSFLNRELESPFMGKRVVITHHAPSKYSIHPRFQDSPLTPSFVNNLEKLILRYQPDLWIHGHTHDSFDYYIKNTRVICNPRGYDHELNSSFKEDLVVEI